MTDIPETMGNAWANAPGMSDELRAKLESLKGREMSPEELFEQRVSFVYGNAPQSCTSTKDEIRAMLAKSNGYPREIGDTIREQAAEIARLREELATRPEAIPAEAVRALVDTTTHRQAWRKSLCLCRDFALSDPDAHDGDISYWEHEIAAFDRTFAALATIKGYKL